MHHFIPPPARAISRPITAAFALVLLAAPLTACNERTVTATERPAFVHTEIVQPRDGQASVTFTGEVQARYRADLSFRVSGRVLERLVDVGAHVNAGDLLARLDPAEQRADFDAATAGVAAAEAQLRVAQATFDRQNKLLSSGFTTRVAYDQAKEQLRTAQSTLELAKAELGRSREALGDTELHARASGVITARSLEVGQVVQATQSVFTLAQDGERDAVFDVPESLFFGDVEHSHVVAGAGVGSRCHRHRLRPGNLSRRRCQELHGSRESRDPEPVACVTLGSAITGTAGTKPGHRNHRCRGPPCRRRSSKPAVWIVDPQTRTASLKPVIVGAYEAGSVLIKEGLEPGDRVVIDGGKLLSSGQPVTFGRRSVMRTRFFVVASAIASALAMAGCQPEAKAPEPVRPVLSTILQPTTSDGHGGGGNSAAPLRNQSRISRAGTNDRTSRQCRRFGCRWTDYCRHRSNCPRAGCEVGESRPFEGRGSARKRNRHRGAEADPDQDRCHDQADA